MWHVRRQRESFSLFRKANRNNCKCTKQKRTEKEKTNKI